MNLYRFVANNPICKRDRDGLSPSDFLTGPVEKAAEGILAVVNTTCCDRCQLGEIKVKVQTKLTVPPHTPEQDEAADAAAEAAERAHSFAELWHWFENPVGSVAVSSINVGTINGIYQNAKFSFLKEKAWLFIRFEVSRCQKVTCKPFFWRTRNDWVEDPATEWQQGNIGMTPEVGWFFGSEDALSHLEENIKAAGKKEFPAE